MNAKKVAVEKELPLSAQAPNTLAQVAPQVSVADIVKHGEKLILPADMTLQAGIELLQRRIKYESEETNMQEKFDALPIDGAVMFDTVLQRRYGWSPAVPTPGFFRDNPPTLMSVEVGYQQTRQVPWGRFLLPNVEGWVQTAATQDGLRYKFAVVACIKRKDEDIVRGLFDELREEIRQNSIYRGKAFRVAFMDDDGDRIVMPTPQFLDTASVDEAMLVLSMDVERSVMTNLFTPITRTQDCINNGIPVKRGVLLGGTFGTGKTMIAHVASKFAEANGITFVYIAKAAELPVAIEFARQYQSPACVIFCEDIDREVTGARTEEMDAVLNTIDGIDSKTSNIIVVLTSNNIAGIHPAMLRPGRLDAVIEVTAPDAHAIERLVRVYARGALDEDIDLREVGRVLAGNIPAVIAEVVKRAKLSQLSMQQRGTRVTKLTAQALLDSAITIQAQVNLLKPKDAAPVPALDEALIGLVRQAFNGNHERLETVDKKVREIHNRVFG